MGTCLSKKSTSTSSSTAFPNPPDQTKPCITQPEIEKPAEETVKKEIFIIKHRKSHEIGRRSEEEEEEKKEVRKSVDVAVAENGKRSAASSSLTTGNGDGIGVATASAPVRTSSCTNEEVESILIQCGWLSRSSSTEKAAGILGAGGPANNTGSGLRGRKYSGSKRSYDFDNDVADKGCDVDNKRGNEEIAVDGGDNDTADGERIRRHRQRQRQARSSSSSIGRRRTPSRERDQSQQQQQRSGSRERGSSGGGGGRRVSRSPGRRSESPITNSGGNGCAASNGAPGKWCRSLPP